MKCFGKNWDRLIKSVKGLVKIMEDTGYKIMKVDIKKAFPVSVSKDYFGTITIKHKSLKKHAIQKDRSK